MTSHFSSSFFFSSSFLSGEDEIIKRLIPGGGGGGGGGLGFSSFLSAGGMIFGGCGGVGTAGFGAADGGFGAGAAGFGGAAAGFGVGGFAALSPAGAAGFGGAAAGRAAPRCSLSITFCASSQASCCTLSLCNFTNACSISFIISNSAAANSFFRPPRASAYRLIISSVTRKLVIIPR